VSLQDIIQLLVHKEESHDESSVNQSKDHMPTTGVLQIPPDTNETSISRTFVLCFLDDLPNPDEGLNELVKTELLHYVVIRLLEGTKPEKSTSPAVVMKGTPNYCKSSRTWQALVVLSRFVTDEIAHKVCDVAFATLSQPLHSQIRYFVEVFIMKCAMIHSDLFGATFVTEVARPNLSLHHVSSLMIMGGNFILGKYRLDYFAQDVDHTRLKRVLASILPWLSSTQGFSRAIAQVLVYALIPRVINVADSNDNSCSHLVDIEHSGGSDWFLRVTYQFLHQNQEMKRLRDKQTRFFEGYNGDDVDLGLKYVLSIPVDESNEADPVHVIEAIKESLRLTYEDAHANDIPVWKQIDQWNMGQDHFDELEEEEDDHGNYPSVVANTEAFSTIQRKIIPLDSLNLALEDLREQRLSNAVGTHKQPLIVCATLVEKVPNLGGLARTCEVFAAQTLVVPDLSVTKMDNFKVKRVLVGGRIDVFGMHRFACDLICAFLRAVVCIDTYDR
jgi:tRNA guanosine-2'-O-methyltransferase